VIYVNLLLDIEKALRTPEREFESIANSISKQYFEDDEVVLALKVITIYSNTIH
jgi:hypothetical protein